jgi:glycosyltransferase involved in cell wall biosynthesis
MKKLNLMHIVYSTGVGGSEKIALELISRGNRSLFNVSVCCLALKGAMHDQFEAAAVQIFLLDKTAGVDLNLFWRLFRLLKKQKTDIVHTHDNSTIFYGTLASRLAGVKRVVNTEHGGMYFESKRKQAMNGWLWKLNDKVVCVSDAVKRDVQAMAKINDRAVTIHNGVDLPGFDLSTDKRAARKELGLAADDFVVCTVGRLNRVKNQRMFLEAAKKMIKIFPCAKFILAGDGPERINLENYVRETGISAGVVFLGPRRDIPVVLRASDCFALTSDYESFGLAVVEAMAAGVPVVATNAGGVGEIVRNGETGILIEKNDVDALTTALLKIKNEKGFAETVVCRAKDFVTKQYGVEKMVRRYEELYLY